MSDKPTCPRRVQRQVWGNERSTPKPWSSLSRHTRRRAILLIVTSAFSISLTPLVAARAEVAATMPSRGDKRSLRSDIQNNWQQQAELVSRTTAQIQTKLDQAVAQRAARMRAVALILRFTGLAQSSATFNRDNAMDNARRQAAAKLLLTRERAEVALLADEHTRVARAQVAIERAVQTAITTELPNKSLQWPAAGEVVRAFGPYVHARSKAMLSRRGIDMEVEQHGHIQAVAAGTVLYAGPIRGLEQGVLVEHPNCITLIAKLGTVAVVAGTQISAGQEVGRAHNSRIYLEVRTKVGPEGTPVDPQAFLVSRQKGVASDPEATAAPATTPGEQ